MAINPGVNISKAVGFAVLEIPKGVVITKAVAYAVLGSANAPVWPGTGFPSATLNVAYSASIDLSPASLPVTFSVVAGALPTGLSLSSSGAIVTISGTPTVAGTFGFTLRASNSFGTVDKVFSITVVTPAGGGGSFTFVM